MINLKLKFTLLTAMTSIVPFTLCILGPYIGLVPKTPHLRYVQILGGILIIALVALLNRIGYKQEKEWRDAIQAIRDRGSRTVTMGHGG